LEFAKLYEIYYKNERKRVKRRRRRQKLRKKKTEIIVNAKSVPCTDCEGDFAPENLEFDHLRNKHFTIGGSQSKNGISINKLLTEIAKCEVVCSECHTKRERARGRTR